MRIELRAEEACLLVIFGTTSVHLRSGNRRLFRALAITKRSHLVLDFTLLAKQALLGELFSSPWKHCMSFCPQSIDNRLRVVVNLRGILGRSESRN
jgi:hypothetical protein